MKKLLLFSMLIMMSCISFSQDENKTSTDEVTTFYFIRHAEKDRSNPSESNPHLMQKGLERAEKWAAVLGNVQFDAVYSSNYHRTIETAKPTADKHNLEIITYDPNAVDGEAFIKTNKGKKVLIVGHSNTIPAFVNAVIGQKMYDDIDDSNNGNLYIVTIINGKVSDQLLTIN